MNIDEKREPQLWPDFELSAFSSASERVNAVFGSTSSPSEENAPQGR